MTYKISSTPSPKAYKEEIADFWEIQALRRPDQYVSKIKISRIISTGLDEIDHEGIESEDDKLEPILDDVFSELNWRHKYSFGKYPFTFSEYSLVLNKNNNLFKDIYLFLLLCTRFNMTEKKIQNGIDATLLFEELCAIVVRNYFGENSDSYVFGTANPGNFKNKVNDLISKIGEGGTFKNPNQNEPTKNDDSVDVVAWKNFADQRAGKLIAFGQCKTGTSWQDDIHKLKPGDFCDNWFYDSPILEPLPLIFICDTLNAQFNLISSQRGYLVFNRFRILEYIKSDLDDGVYKRIKSWLEGAFSIIDLTL